MTAKSATDATPRPAPAGILGIAAFVVAVCAILPIVLVRFLPINDYPFHLARTLILARLDEPAFDRFYELGSFLVPNLAMDAVTFLLTFAMTPETAARTFVALSLLAMLAGTAVLHRAVHGRFSPWPFLAVVLLHNGIFRFGFFNYLFGLGLALFAAAIWYAVPHRSGRLILGFGFACILMLCHMEAFGVFAVIVGSLEIYRYAGSARAAGWFAALKDLLLSALPFAAALALFALLSPTADVTGQGFSYASHLGAKPYGLLYSLSSGVVWLDAATVAVLTAVFAWLCLTGRLAVSGSLAFAAAMMGLAIVVLPQSLMGSLYVDTRLGPALALLLFVVFDIRETGRRTAGWTILVVACGLSVFRTGVLYPLWLDEEKEITPIVRALDAVPSGATLFAATAEPYPQLAAVGPERRSAWHPPLKHVASYAVLNKPVFVPMTWADPTKQPLVIDTEFAPVKAFQGDNPIKVPDRASLDRLIAGLTERIHDERWPKLETVYLLLLGSDRLQPLELPRHIRTVQSGRRHALFQVERPSP